MAPKRRFLAPVFGFLLGATIVAGCSSKMSAPLEPPNSVRRGDLAFQDGQYETAIHEYRNYLDQSGGEYTARVYYKTALAEYRVGHFRDTLRTIDELGEEYPEARWVQVEALRGDAERELGNPIAALQAWDGAWAIGSQKDRDKINQRIVQTVRELPNDKLASARDAATQDEVLALIDRTIGRRMRPTIDEPLPDMEAPVVAHKGVPQPLDSEVEDAPAEANREAEAKVKAAAAIDEGVQADAAVATDAATADATDRVDAEKAAAGTAALAATAPIYESTVETNRETAPVGAEGVAVLGQDQKPMQGKVGVLLPLSGASRDAGERALRGLRLVFAPDSDDLVIKDTGSDAATALSMMSQLTADAAVKVVIGPLRGDDAERVAPVAERAHMPLLLLSQQDGLSGAYALQVGMTRSKMLGTLLDYAMTRGRIRNIGILYPEDIAGKQLLVTLRQEIERRGGTVVGSQGYSPTTKSVAIGSLMKWRDDKQVQGIFLPDDVAVAEGFARFMQREMPDVTLLGIRGWEGLAVQREDGGEGISGVLFADTFFPGSDRQGTKDFVARFQKAYGSAPGSQEAEAYDAGLLARRALESGALTRADVHQELRYPGTIDGAAGELPATGTGFERRFFLLRVFDGKLQEAGN